MSKRSKTAEQIVAELRAIDRANSRLASPLLCEQAAIISDGPQTWSITHSWPWVRGLLTDFGVVRDVGVTETPTGIPHLFHRSPTTEITPLGIEVRAFLKTAALLKASPQKGQADE